MKYEEENGGGWLLPGCLGWVMGMIMISVNKRNYSSPEDVEKKVQEALRSSQPTAVRIINQDSERQAIEYEMPRGTKRVLFAYELNGETVYLPLDKIKELERLKSDKEIDARLSQGELEEKSQLEEK